MKQYNYIYKITNLENGKIYIGKHSTDNLNDSYMGSGKILCKSKAKYGKNNFKKDIIAFSDNEDSLNFLEKFYIKKYKSQDSSIGYNITDGGEGCTGFHPSEASRKKMSAAHKGRISNMKGKKMSDDVRKKMSNSLKGKPSWNKGKKMSDEYCIKMSIAHKGKHLSNETRKKLSVTFSGEKNPFYGKHHSDASRRKMSIAKRGRKLSDETKVKIGAAKKGNKYMLGKHLSNETREKMSAAQKLRRINEMQNIIILTGN